MNYPATPEIDKMKAVQEESQTIGAFLEWMEESSYSLRDHSIEYLLAKYFNIDLKKVSDEKDAIYEYVRQQNVG